MVEVPLAETAWGEVHGHQTKKKRKRHQMQKMLAEEPGPKDLAQRWA